MFIVVPRDPQAAQRLDPPGRPREWSDVHDGCMHIETEIKGDVLTLRLEGNPLGEMHARALYQHVQRHMNKGVKHVVVNFADVKHINSAGIGGLVRTWGAMNTRGVDLRLTAVNTNVRKILESTRLVEYFAIDPGTRR
jgi:anti-anti-sigma factor